MNPRRVFVTVGAQMPFDRLVHAVDGWAAGRDDLDVFAQIGDSDAPPEHIAWERRLDSGRFAAEVAQADLLVSHAGMGTIITALTESKPLVAMPRLGARRETRNDHQVATAARFRDRRGIYIADDETELVAILQSCKMQAPLPIGAEASPTLTGRIRAFIEQ